MLRYEPGLSSLYSLCSAPLVYVPTQRTRNGVLDLGDVGEVGGVGNPQATHAVGVAPLLEETNGRTC